MAGNNGDEKRLVALTVAAMFVFVVLVVLFGGIPAFQRHQTITIQTPKVGGVLMTPHLLPA